MDYPQNKNLTKYRQELDEYVRDAELHIIDMRKKIRQARAELGILKKLNTKGDTECKPEKKNQ